MPSWLRRLVTRGPSPPLTGAPAVRRQKTYSAASGYVYQYFYEGHRPSARGGDGGTEYVFEVSSDRATHAPVAVFLSDTVLDSWQRETARELSSSERYAVVKLVLFRALDDSPGPLRADEAIPVRSADLTAIAEQLGFL